MNTFTEVKASKKSISSRKPVYGFGVNDSKYLTNPIINGKKSVCPYYRKWSDMLKRCYSDKFLANHPTYIGCTVVKAWLTFSNFRGWMVAQDWQGKSLDKDLLCQGNKVYSPISCLLVTSQVNSLLNAQKAGRGIFPQGVSFKKQDNKFQAQISINGKQKHVGYYDTSKEAYAAYKDAKYELIKQVASGQSESIKLALLRYVIA